MHNLHGSDAVNDSKKTQRERAYQHISRKLIEGAFPAGARLSPTALAREIGVSHTPVREAISQLQSEGLVVHSAHRGAFVTEMDREGLVDLIEMRTILETHAAAQAARRISPAQLRELDEAWEGLCRVAERFDIPPGSDPRPALQDWLLLDLVFHMVLVRAGGNRHMIRVIEDLRIMTQMFGFRNDPPTAWADPAAFAAENLRVHRDVYEAVRRRDAKAARRAMLVHMRRARRNTLSRFDWLRRQGGTDDALTKDFPDSMRELIRDIQQRQRTDSQLAGGEPSGTKAREKGKPRSGPH
jgi:DNA-binding GntR family transcriptional regulator